MRGAALLLPFVAFASAFAVANELSHDYADGAEVLVYANKIGPFHNPLETYAYFELPGCPPASWDHKFPSLGQALAGDELYKMNMPVAFNRTVERVPVCTLDPKLSDINKWRQMVKEQYWYQLVSDELPMWATLGRIENGVPMIYSHQNFSFGTNGKHIVMVNLTADTPVSLDSITTIQFTFSASFVAMPHRSFEKRFDRYLDDDFFEHNIHWFSIVNSFMLVFSLVGVVLYILNRTLRADYARFDEYRAARDAGKEEWVEVRGWKQLQNDVFRVPPRPVLLCALIGTGYQIAILLLIVTVVSIASVVYTSAGSFATYSVFAFALTSYCAGFFSARQFSRYTLAGPSISSQWINCMAATGTLFPGTILLMGLLLNFVAIAYDSAQAIPFGGMVVVLLLWLCVSLPLVVLGTVIGRHTKLGGNSAGGTKLAAAAPRINQIPRMIPGRQWLNRRRVLVLLGGVLPFFSIIMEIYFVFTSFWNYKVYYVYGFMLLALTIFVIVTACVAIVVTYALLNSEDHRWPWPAFFAGASTSLYVFGYAIFYFHFKTRMTGFLMVAFYFTYSLMMCMTIAVLSGTVAFVASSRFVETIYRNIKAD